MALPKPQWKMPTKTRRDYKTTAWGRLLRNSNIVNGLTQFLEPTSHFGSSFSEGRSLSEFFGMRYADSPTFATFCKGLEAPEPPASISAFLRLSGSQIPVDGAVFRSDLWRIAEGFRIPLPETRRGVKLRWDFGRNPSAKPTQEQSRKQCTGRPLCGITTRSVSEGCDSVAPIARSRFGL